jgi:hypothetical protein
MFWLILLAAVLVWWLLRRRRRPRRVRAVHQFQIDWYVDPSGEHITAWHEYNRRHSDKAGFLIHPGSYRLRAWCAHPSCPFELVVDDDQEPKARRAYQRFHRGAA